MKETIKKLEAKVAALERHCELMAERKQQDFTELSALVPFCLDKMLECPEWAKEVKDTELGGGIPSVEAVDMLVRRMDAEVHVKPSFKAAFEALCKAAVG